MIKESVICWPDKEWKFWFLYDREINKQFRINVEHLSIEEQKGFFWHKAESFPDEVDNLLIDSLKTIGLLNQENDNDFFVKSPKIDPIEIFQLEEKVNIFVENEKYAQSINRVITTYDFKNLEVRILTLNDILSQNTEIKETEKNFLFFTKFVPSKFQKYIGELNNIIPIFFNEGDLLIGPELKADGCPCIECLHIRLGASSVDPFSFERQIEVAEKEPLFLEESILNSNTLRLSDLLFQLVLRYLIDLQKEESETSLFIRYELANSYIFINHFLSVPHKNIKRLQNFNSNKYKKIGVH